jgi:tetratricopeptide (TPR) repeat protein
MMVLAIILGVLFKHRTSSTTYQGTSAESVESSAISHSANSSATAGPTKLERAMEALEKEKFAAAAMLFEEFIVSEPENKPEVAVLYARALVGGAASILDTNEKKAEALLRKAIDIDPKNARPYYYLGKLYTSIKDYTKAVQAYDKAIILDPHFPDSFFNLGFLYFSRKDYGKAEEMFQRTVELTPPYLDEAYYNLAVVQNLQDKTDKSIRNLEKALEVNPGNKRAKKFLNSIKPISQNAGETKQSENQGLAIARAGTPLDHCRLCNNGQICAAHQPKPSLSDQEIRL